MSTWRGLLTVLMLFQLLPNGGHQGLTMDFIYLLPDTGPPPVIISLIDTAALSLKDASDPSKDLFTNHSDQNGDVKSKSILSQNILKKDDLNETFVEEVIDSIKQEVPSLLMTEPTQSKNEKNLSEQVVGETIQKLNNDPSSDNINVNVSLNTSAKDPAEDIPSFAEWAQKKLEAEQQDTVLNESVQTNNNNPNIGTKIYNKQKRSKNYASPACGAKLIAANPEAGSPNSILSPNKDEYMLNTCTSKIWFVVGLCEAIQVQKIELANFELFSSSPKEFSVYISDRFPTRDWTSVGQFTAKDAREVQMFNLFPQLFGKFIKVELISYHGSEHYCPISEFNVYGTSEFEVLEKENDHSPQVDYDDEEDEDILKEILGTNAKSHESRNLFGSARDAVMSIMKKAAQVLAKSSPSENDSANNNGHSKNPRRYCDTPSHIIVCDNCSETFFNKVYEFISCDMTSLNRLISKRFIYELLRDSNLCEKFGLNFKNGKTISYNKEKALYFSAVFMPTYLAALCNILAIDERKVVLNVSFDYEIISAAINETDVENSEGINISNKIELSLESTGTLESIGLPMDENNQNEKNSIPGNENFADEMSNDSVKAVNSLTQDFDNILDSNSEKNYVKLHTEDEPFSLVSPDDFKDANDFIMENTKHNDISEIDQSSGLADVQQTSETVEELQENKLEDDKINLNITPEDSIISEASGLDFSDFDQMILDPISQTSTNTPNQGQPPQKESVFLRLSNRVKVLERNMSLSGQYLEELSKRYKKQVEDMQKNLVSMTEDIKKSEEREQKYIELIVGLQNQLQHLNETVKILIADKNSWFGNVTLYELILYTLLIQLVTVYFFKKVIGDSVSSTPVLRLPNKNKKNNVENNKLRRKSVEGVSGHESPVSKLRRPSEEALRITRESIENDDEENDSVNGTLNPSVFAKNRKRKGSVNYKINPLVVMDESDLVVQPNTPDRNKRDWERQDSLGVLRENAILLDDQEFVSAGTEIVDFTKVQCDSNVKKVNKPQKKELPNINGSLGIKSKNSKPSKSRRLSSPAFFRTALNRSISQNTPSPTASKKSDRSFNKTEQELNIINASLNIEAERTATVSLGDNNSLCESTNDGNSTKQTKRKTLKSIFKKVF